MTAISTKRLEMAEARRRRRAKQRQQAQDGSDPRVRAKLDAHLAAGRFYEAQQLYQSLYNRLAARGNHSQAVDLLQEGAEKLLKHGQGNAGGELALLLIECHRHAETVPSRPVVDALLGLAAVFPDDESQKTVKTDLLKAVIRWTVDAAQGAQDESSGQVLSVQGDQEANYALAVHLTKLGEDGQAQRYWIRSGHVQEHAAQLVEWAKKGYVGELDLFVARTVLQYLALGDMESANVVFALFKERHEEVLDTPLINFITFLLQTLEREAKPLFLMLRAKYNAATQRDPSFKWYLDKIGELFYDIPVPKGMLEDLFSGLKA